MQMEYPVLFRLYVSDYLIICEQKIVQSSKMFLPKSKKHVQFVT